MAHFKGTLAGNTSVLNTVGSRSKGIAAVLSSNQGLVHASIIQDDDGVDQLMVTVASQGLPVQDVKTHTVVYSGPLASVRGLIEHTAKNKAPI